MEELSGQEQAVFNVPNTSTNRSILGVDSPTSSNVYVQFLYRGNQIWWGVCTGAQAAATNLQCIAYNAVYLALKQAPVLVTSDQNISPFGGPAPVGISPPILPSNANPMAIASNILKYAYGANLNADSTWANILVGWGDIPMIGSYNFSILTDNAFNALAALAQSLNLDFWGSGTPNDMMYNIGTRDATTYSDVDFQYESSTQRGLDRSQLINSVIVFGTDGNGNSIMSVAGSGGPVQKYVYNQPSSITELYNIAAYELALLNNPSTGVSLSVLTDVAALWHPGQYVTCNRADLALVGTFEILRITKGPVLSTVEVEKAMPRLDVNLQNLTQQVNGIALNQT
jgi:hypothetical protein